jgi:hypothetical protein
MFIAIITVVILLTWRYADWKNWKQHESTMLLFSFGNLVYNFVYHDHYLWKMKPDITNYSVMEIILTVTVFPLTALLLLSGFPSDLKSRLMRISKFILIYFTAEVILLKFNKIEYDYGWNIWWSLGWDCIMFPILAIHHKKPLLAFLLSAILFFLMNWLFPFNLD